MEVPIIPLRLFYNKVRTGFSYALRNPHQAGLAYNSYVRQRWLELIQKCISIETIRSSGLYGIERPGGLFNSNIYMIVKGESVTNSDPECVQFVHTFDAGYYSSLV